MVGDNTTLNVYKSTNPLNDSRLLPIIGLECNGLCQEKNGFEDSWHTYSHINLH